MFWISALCLIHRVPIGETHDIFSRYGRRNMKVPYPIRYATPYGGRLIWTLPGNTKVICHLKDKNKIRHKKRWSQIMYMYYFLGHKLVDNENLTEQQKRARKRNTYLLALDGDVDFQVMTNTGKKQLTLQKIYIAVT